MLLSTQSVIQTIASHPTFLYAHTVQMLNAVGFFVCRSHALPRHDPWYRPVEEFIAAHKDVLTLQWSETFEDPSMMFGEAEHSLYLLKCA